MKHTGKADFHSCPPLKRNSGIPKGSTADLSPFVIAVEELGHHRITMLPLPVCTLMRLPPKPTRRVTRWRSEEALDRSSRSN